MREPEQNDDPFGNSYLPLAHVKQTNALVLHIQYTYTTRYMEWNGIGSYANERTEPDTGAATMSLDSDEIIAK